MHLISVIIPVYKTEKYLIKCVDSLLEQTYTNLEIILVDDGSPDQCPEICDNYALKDSRVKVVHKSNNGVSGARNSGLDSANGDYITFVDSDDYIEKNMYQSMMSIVDTYKCDFVLCDCTKDYPDHSELYTHNIREGFYNYKQLKEEYYPHLLMMENLEYPATISNWLCLFKSELLVDEDLRLIRYPVGIRFSEDLLFGSQIMLNARSFFYMKGSAFYHYVIHDDSFSRIFVDSIWNDYLSLCRLTDEIFSKKTYDFSKQIDLLILFFVFKTISDIAETTQFSIKDKIEKATVVLKDDYVRKMFERLSINNIAVTKKQKILIFFYKHNLFIKPILKYLQRSHNG